MKFMLYKLVDLLGPKKGPKTFKAQK